MQVLKQKPPKWIWKGVHKIFNLKDIEPAFAYGDIVFNPYGNYLDPTMLAHEGIHWKQQEKMGKDKWWKKYLKNPKFRLEQEIPAYQMQYKVAKRFITDKNVLNKVLVGLAEDLGGEMYGNVMSKSEALKVIKNEK